MVEFASLANWVARLTTGPLAFVSAVCAAIVLSSIALLLKLRTVDLRKKIFLLEIERTELQNKISEALQSLADGLKTAEKLVNFSPDVVLGYFDRVIAELENQLKGYKI